jgi:hypothetical protein
MIEREQVAQALFQRITTRVTFAESGRRLRDPDTIDRDKTPVLMLVEHDEGFERSSPSRPPKRLMHFRALLYTDVGDNENAIPGTTINNLLDQLEAALAPDDMSTGRCRLGSLVDSVMIEGEIIKAAGDVTGKSIAIVPIIIVLP